MKTIDVKYLPGDECYVRGQDRTCYIDNISIRKDDSGNIDITYEWYNLDVGMECTEVWDDGYFDTSDIGVSIFDTYEELARAFPALYHYLPEDQR